MKLNIYSATVILLVVFGVFTGIHTWIGTVDPATIDPNLQIVYNGLAYIFLTSSVAPLWVIVRNIYGYLENYFGTEPDMRSQLHYEANKLMETWVKYEGYIKGLTIMMMAFFAGTRLEPYAIYIAGATAFLVDLIRTSLHKIGKEE